ncbi:hypothetical protein KJY73_11870 [Bowmanella sp. Y26]|uniref:hypothetical protein n=1 Tax=Bowmanella yangjiangensis TaxID=2811230 RepID=UPI001BDD6C80|nr:hypothetical protein [Bowmanella yangjiangensis]MBT1064277.1 hypothetical protein [Bowmanella yangjiangensis]
MPIKKWFIQYLLGFPILFALLSGIQYLKGRSWDYALSFGLLWSLISLAIFASTRLYYYRKGMYCKVCNDLPGQGSTEDKTELTSKE